MSDVPADERTERRRQRRQLAKRLRDEGKTYAAIGAELGVSGQRASEMVREELRWLAHPSRGRQPSEPTT